MLSALMVNWRSDVNTPLRLNGLTIRSESTPSMASRSTMPSGWATIEPKRTPLVTRSACASLPLAPASVIAAARIACRSPVISRARSSTSPEPIKAIVCRSLENDGSMESNCALSNPSDTKTLATSSAEPPMTGSLWQPKQEFESGPLVRLDGVLALGRDDRLRRLRPSGTVHGSEFRLEQRAPALDEGGESRWAGCGDRVEIEMRAGRKDALVPACRKRASADHGGGRAQSERCAQQPLHGPPVALVQRARSAPDCIILTSRASAASTFPARASPSVAARLKPHETSGAPSSFGALTVSAGLTIVPPAEIVRPSAGGRALSRVAARSVDRTGGNK